MHESLNTNQFDYNKSSRTFVAEASDLGFKSGMIPVEISLTSERTGKVEGFTLDFIEEDGSLKFEAGGPALKALGVKILIIND
jgi:hypothetical protein